MMDEEDRFSASSAESERDQEPDDAMEDADDVENDAEQDDDNNDEDEDDDAGNGAGPDETTDNTEDVKIDTASRQKSSTPTANFTFLSRPRPRAEVLDARLYDIVPTMAAPQATSINSLAITPDLRYWFTGGSDGYIRKYDGPGTINGKLALTVAQKHPFVDSVTKAGILMSYWENEEPTAPGRGDQDHVLSPVYSLAVQSEALWLLSGLESGGINLQSVRHDEGKKICSLQKHSNAVSVLTLAQDEKSVLSGGWDKNVFDWDLNTGQTKRSFDGSGGQISAIELRPASGDPIPAEADEPPLSNTISTNNSLPMMTDNSNQATNHANTNPVETAASYGARDDQASSTHESLFGGSDAGSLFGDTAGDQPFGQDDDEFGTAMNMMPGHEGGMDHSADMAMAGMEIEKGIEKDPGHSALPAPTTQPDRLPLEPSADDTMEVDITAPDQQSIDIKDEPSSHQPLHAQNQAPLQEIPQSDDQLLHKSPLAAHNDPNERHQSGDSSPMLVTAQPHRPDFDPSQTSSTTFLSSAMDGTIRIWDRRVPNAVARIGNRPGVPPWCMSACWSPDGNMIYAGRRNGTVEEFDVRRANRMWEPERVLKFPGGSGAVSAVRPMVNGRHLVCASHDILRLYDLRDTRAFKHSTVPFLIIPGPPRAGVISSLYIDPTCRFMLSAAGTRGWEGSSTEVLIGYEINVSGG